MIQEIEQEIDIFGGRIISCLWELAYKVLVADQH